LVGVNGSKSRVTRSLADAREAAFQKAVNVGHPLAVHNITPFPEAILELYVLKTNMRSSLAMRMCSWPGTTALSTLAGIMVMRTPP